MHVEILQCIFFWLSESQLSSALQLLKTAIKNNKNFSNEVPTRVASVLEYTSKLDARNLE